MAEAVSLGEGVRRSTSPNPWVGAVIVPRGGAPVALGATQPPGGPHAEVVALDLAGDSALGSTLYVTLEPCGHHGRTPPCTQAVISAGVARVVVALEDPDPKVSGRGIQALRESGVVVDLGIGAGEAERSLAPYLKHRRTGRPWVVLKLACTLDGRIAAPDGTSRWITGPEARQDSHALRAEMTRCSSGLERSAPTTPSSRCAAPRVANPLRVVLGRPPGRRRGSTRR